MTETEKKTIFEYPLNERVRIYLRLSYLLNNLQELLNRTTSIDHRFALSTLFEILEVGARNDLRVELLKDLERQRLALQSYQNNPSVDRIVLQEELEKFDRAFENLSTNTGRLGQNLLNHDWLMNIRSRVNIPGGTCTFDLPAYSTWLGFSPEQRRKDIQIWVDTFREYTDAIFLILKMLRHNIIWQRMTSHQGQYQRGLPIDKGFQMVTIQLSASENIYPVVSGTRLKLAIHFYRLDPKQVHHQIKSSGKSTVFNTTMANNPVKAKITKNTEFLLGLSA